MENQLATGDTPEMDVDPNTGNMYILYMNNGVKYAIIDRDGNILTQESVDVSGASLDSGLGNFGATIAVDTQGYPHICFREYVGKDPDNTPLYTTYYVRKTSTGWDKRVVLSERVRRGYMIRLDVDENNVVHIVQGFVFNETGSIWGRIRYYRIINNAVESTQILGETKQYVYRADDRIEIDTYPGGKVHVISGIPNPNGNVYYFYSSDRGDTFSAGADIHPASAYGRNGSVDMQIDGTGNIHMCYGTSEDSERSGKPSIHYVKISNGNVVTDKPVTPLNAVVDWKIGMGVGSIAVSDNGLNIILAYVSAPGGELSAIYSQDGGNNWSAPTKLADACGSDESRNKHIIRAHSNDFCLAYPHSYKVWYRTISFSTNQPPMADAGGPYVGQEGSTVQFDASNSRDIDGTITKYEWDWENDGVYDVATIFATVQHVYEDDFIGQMKLRVTDNENSISTDLSNVTIQNVPPTADANGPYSGEPETDILLTGTATDPSVQDQATLIFEWDLNNDGMFESIGRNVTARYSLGGSHRVMLRVTDDDAGRDIDTTYVVISNEPPQVTMIPPQQIMIGESFAPIQLDYFVYDPDNADHEITWEAKGQNHIQVMISNRIAFPQPIDAEWIGTENITFVATDPGGLQDSTVTSFSVSELSQRPVIGNIPAQIKNEGTPFDPIILDNYVEDGDNDVTELTWRVRNNIELLYTLNSRILTVSWPNPDWFGNENLQVIATDPVGLSDTAYVSFTILNINDPPVISGLTGQTVANNENFDPIILDNHVTDVDHPDDELFWSYSGNSQLIVNIDEFRVATISKPQPTWYGNESITFEVSDGLLSDQTTIIFTVNPINQAPVITSIPGQTVGENQPFQSIYLDGFVNDPDNEDNEISWDIRGANNLLLQLIDRTLSIAVPDSEWSGTESLTFIARDPFNLADTVWADFSVVPINDPPKLSALPQFSILEDDTLEINQSYLRTLVHDPDNLPQDLQFNITGNLNLNWHLDSDLDKLLIYSYFENWYGIENLMLNVFDGEGGSDSGLMRVNVQPLPDQPTAFTVVSPNSITFTSIPQSIIFKWRKSVDPDNNSQINYVLSLSDQYSFQHVFDSFTQLVDTMYVYQSSPPLKDGIYFWQVKAMSRSGLSTQSDIGTFSINRTGVTDSNDSGLPDEFALVGNYPNPFNPQTHITYHVPERTLIEISIYNSVGQKIKNLEYTAKDAGVHTATWDGRDEFGNQVSSGIYVCFMKADQIRFSKKMLLLR
ncbi:T9SS type A sorting domain-containing protein [candidate division KSB1 bacterium]|nr:T9SS type A sorting domain-containing protein [candidate division KSB1 bacterium]